MRHRFVWVLMGLLVIAAGVSIAGWLGGDELAGTVFLVICIGLGAYLGVGWGGKQAAETDEYRQAWLAKRKQRKPGPSDEKPSS